MTLHRFFLSPDNIKSDRVFISPEISKQLTKVLRLKKGDQILVLDNEGNEYLIELTQMISDNVGGKILSRQINTNEPKLKISLYQALTTKDKFETILQKGTEIGVSEFIPVETKRSLLKISDLKPERLERFKKIIQEAAEQSQRGKIPELSSAMKFSDAITQAAETGPTIIAWEKESQNSLKEVLSQLSISGQINIFIGPEGGFEQSEIELAKNQGVIPVSLGSRILRTETAGPVLAALILFDQTPS